MTAQELADARRLLDLYEHLLWFIDKGYGDNEDRRWADWLSSLARASAAELISSSHSDD